jgi:hypothetical protein
MMDNEANFSNQMVENSSKFEDNLKIFDYYLMVTQLCAFMASFLIADNESKNSLSLKHDYSQRKI